MKKYIFALGPGLLGIGLCFLFSWREANFVQDLGLPWVTRVNLSAMAVSWLLIGLGLSFFLVLAMFIYDVTTFIEKRLERRSMRDSRKG